MFGGSMIVLRYVLGLMAACVAVVTISLLSGVLWSPVVWIAHAIRAPDPSCGECFDPLVAGIFSGILGAGWVFGSWLPFFRRQHFGHPLAFLILGITICCVLWPDSSHGTEVWLPPVIGFIAGASVLFCLLLVLSRRTIRFS
jgi:hypothetical protein